MFHHLFLAIFFLALSLLAFSTVTFASNSPLVNNGDGSDNPRALTVSEFRAQNHWYVGLGVGMPLTNEHITYHHSDNTSHTVKGSDFSYFTHFFLGFDMALSQQNHFLIDATWTPTNHFGSSALMSYQGSLNLRYQRYFGDNFNIGVFAGLGSISTFAYTNSALYETLSAAYNFGASVEYFMAKRHALSLTYTYSSVMNDTTFAGIILPGNPTAIPIAGITSVDLPNRHLLMITYRYVFGH